MPVSEIDLLQTEQIEALQDDVKELRDKLNLIVTDITHATNGITKKLNDAIDDADDLNTVIMAGYSVGSGSGTANTGILKRLDELVNNFEKHRYELFPGSSSQSGTSYKEVHPPTSATASSPPYSGYSQPGCNLSGTAQGSATRSSHTSVSEAATASTPSYTSESQSVMTLKTKGETRARKIARTLLKRSR
jgi:hypothetical protein